MLNRQPFASLTQKPEYTMLGRTYALGYEPDLADVLLQRPRRTVLNPQWKWAVWYPLRRSGKFAALPADEQRVILAEHGAIGMSYGAGDYAHDVRLACHGLDKDDNDFVVGLIGKDLYPLSAIVQSMRKTQQTSLYLERLGPFFVGRAVWQSALSYASVLCSRRPAGPSAGGPGRLRLARRRREVRRRRERRRAAMPGRLLVGVGEPDERRLAPGGAEERHADRQAAEISHRHGDVRIAGHRR